MIITKKYAKKLIREGKAVYGTTLKPNQSGHVYVAIDRIDLQRIDHYRERMKKWLYEWDGRPWEGALPKTKKDIAIVCPSEKIILSRKDREIIIKDDQEHCRYCGEAPERIVRR